MGIGNDIAEVATAGIVAGVALKTMDAITKQSRKKKKARRMW
jgi:hypothetical protein